MTLLSHKITAVKPCNIIKNKTQVKWVNILQRGIFKADLKPKNVYRSREAKALEVLTKMGSLDLINLVIVIKERMIMIPLVTIQFTLVKVMILNLRKMRTLIHFLLMFLKTYRIFLKPTCPSP